MKPYTHEEDEILRSLYMTHEHAEIGEIIGRSRHSVRKRCNKLGLIKHSFLTNEQLEIIREWYITHKDDTIEDFNLDALAEKVGMLKSNVSREAKKMGLTDVTRIHNDVYRNELGERTKRYIAEKGHPRGFLGHNHTAQARLKISMASKSYHSKRSPLDVFSVSNKMIQTRIKTYGHGGTSIHMYNTYNRANGGKRADLNDLFVRSSWEANYARYLNFLIEQGEIASWEYECKVFLFEAIVRGIRSYTPDFKVIYFDGSYEWHEVKGYMDKKSQTKLNRMAKFYPQEKVVIIDKDVYRSISKWSALIPNWE